MILRNVSYTGSHAAAKLLAEVSSASCKIVCIYTVYQQVLDVYRPCAAMPYLSDTALVMGVLLNWPSG